MNNDFRSIKLKVLIPVRDRLDTLRNVVDLIFKVTQDADCSIVVSSNNCGEETVSYLKSCSKNNKNLSYLTSNSTLSMSKNFDRLVRFALEEIPESELKSTWLYITGADDGLTRQAIPELQKAVFKYPEVQLIKAERITYWWPNAVTKGSSAKIVYKEQSHKFKIKNNKRSFSQLLRGKRSWFSMPFLYTGTFIRADLLSEMFSADVFYNSQNPDIYSMCALMNYHSSYLEISKPLVISGISPKSNGNAFIGGNLERQLQFKSENDISIHRNMLFEKSPSGAEYNLYLSESFFASRILKDQKVFQYLWISLRKKNPYRHLYGARLRAYTDWKWKKYYMMILRVQYFANALYSRFVDGCFRVVILGGTEFKLSDLVEVENFVSSRLEKPPNVVHLAKRCISNIIKTFTKIV